MEDPTDELQRITYQPELSCAKGGLAPPRRAPCLSAAPGRRGGFGHLHPRGPLSLTSKTQRGQLLLTRTPHTNKGYYSLWKALSFGEDEDWRWDRALVFDADS